MLDPYVQHAFQGSEDQGIFPSLQDQAVNA